MADGNDKAVIKFGGCIFFLIILLPHLLIMFVDGIRVEMMKNKEQLMHEGTLKTIKGDDGDVIDCVDIKKQPAFNNPLLKNHTIEMEPHVHSSGNEVEKNQQNIFFQNWQKNGECPNGSIPILRTKHFNLPRRSYSTMSDDDSSNHEYAKVDTTEGVYLGAHARINIWNPMTNSGEMSIAQMWVVSGDGDALNTMEVGWKASDGEKLTRLFIYWTSDNYKSTGCYNLECSGFVQTNKNFLLGGLLIPVSTYGGQQNEMPITVQKENENWWLRLNDNVIGYWPTSIFTNFKESAKVIAWGGEIYNSQTGGHHTTTQMGSGHFPPESFGKAAFMKKIGYSDESGHVIDAENIQKYVTNSNCYDLALGRGGENDGVFFYFGGPGYSEKCP